MKHFVDDRDAFVPGFDLLGNRLADEVRESLRADLFNTDLDSDEEIRKYVRGWLALNIVHATPTMPEI